MKLKRHYLIEISDEGRKYAFQQFLKRNEIKNSIEEIRKLVVEGYGRIKVPGIARREESQELINVIGVGFSSPGLYQGKRIRVPCLVPREYVKKVVTPYEVINCYYLARTKPLVALKEITQLAIESKVQLGLWGSTCLEIFTSLPYTNENSDLDLLMGIIDVETIQTFLEECKKIAKVYNTQIDLEIDLPNGYGVKAEEVFLDVDQILGKGLVDVKLIPKTTILNFLKKD